MTMKNTDINLLDSDINVENKDIMPLDTRIESEYDKADTMLLNTPERLEYDNLVSSSLSFPCLTRESRAKTCFMPQAFRFAESGRSMVEMLGVLAVIGVLSIGGIAGYSYGMDKYRANELTNTGNAFLREPGGGAACQHRYKGNLFRAICQ